VGPDVLSRRASREDRERRSRVDRSGAGEPVAVAVGGDGP
jgi:hypothetical protein